MAFYESRSNRRSRLSVSERTRPSNPHRTFTERLMSLSASAPKALKLSRAPGLQARRGAQDFRRWLRKAYSPNERSTEKVGWKLVDMYVALIFLDGNVVRRYCTLFMENTDRQDIGLNPACRSYNKPESPHRQRVLRVSKTVRRQIGQNSACRSVSDPSRCLWL